MTVLALLGVVLVLFAAAAVATRGGGGLADAPQDLPDLVLPDGPLQPQDLAGLRFSMAPRGYRMSEVDAVLDRLADELADRDRRLAALGALGADRPVLDGSAPHPLTADPAAADGAPAPAAHPSGGDGPS